MQTRVTLRPGQKGTLKLVRQYGDRLVRIRYRDDPKSGKRYTTVELIVSERAWYRYGPRETWDETKPVRLRVAFEEHEIRRSLKQAGGTWDPKLRLWRTTLGEAHRLGLMERIVH